MFRALAVFCLVAGVTAPASVDAKPKKTAAVAKTSKKSKAKKKTKKDDRRPTKKSLARRDNMPRGFAWPPTKRMHEAEAACEAKLDDLGIEHKPGSAEGRVVDPLIIPGEAGTITFSGVTWVPAFTTRSQPVDCQLVLALAQFSPQLHDLGVERVTFGSIFRWTNVRVMGKTKNILSRHALGIAMDIISFTDTDGRVAYVHKDYKKGDELLLSIEQAVNASGLFRILLTPKNDPISHSDHFHLEAATDYTAPTS